MFKCEFSLRLKGIMTRQGADRLAHLLGYAVIIVAVYHGLLMPGHIFFKATNSQTPYRGMLHLNIFLISLFLTKYMPIATPPVNYKYNRLFESNLLVLREIY